MPKHCKNQACGAVGASSCSCQKECHEKGRRGPNTVKTKHLGPSGPLLVFAKRNVMRGQEVPKHCKKQGFWGRRAPGTLANLWSPPDRVRTWPGIPSPGLP